jgi:hypothetical protein
MASREPSGGNDEENEDDLLRQRLHVLDSTMNFVEGRTERLNSSPAAPSTGKVARRSGNSEQLSASSFGRLE